MDRKRLFFVSGLLSISIYLLIFLFMFWYLYNKNEELKKYAIQSKSVEVSLVEPPKQKRSQKISKSSKKSKVERKKTEKPVKKEGSSSAKSGVDIEKLFSSVKTPRKSGSTSPKKSSSPSRLKGEGFKNRKSAAEILKSMNIKDIGRELANRSIRAVEGESDPYLSKIYEILYKYWLPSQESAGNRAKVKIKIGPEGDFDYTVLLFSGSETFNKELVEYLEYLKTKKFPPPKEGSKDIVVYFEAKE